MIISSPFYLFHIKKFTRGKNMYAGPPVEIIGVLIVTAAGFIKQSSKPSNPGTTAHQSAEYSQHQV